jgi:hypothetical protein
MEPKKQISRDSSRAAPAPALSTLHRCARDHAGPEQFCLELAKIFQVRPTEVALLRVEDNSLRFLFPTALRAAGTIPVSSASAIAAHTVSNKKVESYNGFARIKHASVFETVKLGQSEDDTPLEKPIQRLMSAPVLDKKGSVLGVIQVCRKGFDLTSSGPEFAPSDLSKLEGAAAAAGEAAFMRKDAGISLK